MEENITGRKGLHAKHYTQQAINIYGQKISNTDIGLEIRDAIIRKSKYFKLETEENARIVQKEKNLRYPKIRLVLFGHKIIDEEEIIKLKMYEEIDGKEKVLMNIELDVMISYDNRMFNKTH